MLSISNNKRYLLEDGKPFFWLGDTAWLLFSRCSIDDAYIYLKNRAAKGFNVIQIMLTNEIGVADIYGNKPFIDNDLCKIDVNGTYIQNALKMCKIANELGMYVAIVPCWGSLAKDGYLNTLNVVEFSTMVSDIFKDIDKLIYFVGGDVRGDVCFNVFNLMGKTLKDLNKNKFVTFHPFGRTSSSYWFSDVDWLDINMFQSGHRRYDQKNLSYWDDNNGKELWYGEDNFGYVYHDSKYLKPTLDSEPSYEQIPQGLHNPNEPYWQACDVRRYAYWSVFAGACGHTYGDNSIIQFYDESTIKIAYSAKDYWYMAIHHSGSSQMKFLKDLMCSVDFINGKDRCDLLTSPQKEKYGRVQVFAGENYLFAYDYLGEEFSLNLSEFKQNLSAYWFDPENGSMSYFGEVKGENISFKPQKKYSTDNDWVLVLKY